MHATKTPNGGRLSRECFDGLLAKRLPKTPYVSLPNILAGEEGEKELLQDDCRVDNLYHEVSRLIESHNQALMDKFTEMHQ